MSSESIPDKAEASNMLSLALKSLFVVAENYPELKANQNFLKLQEELSNTEDMIAFARRFYNDTTMLYNVQIRAVPSNIVATIFNFRERELFEAPGERERVQGRGPREGGPLIRGGKAVAFCRL